MKQSLVIIALLLFLILGACQLPQDNPVPEGKPGALYTEAAQTVAVQLTMVAIDKPDSTQSPDGSSSEETPLAVPSSTFVIPSYTPQGAGGEVPQACDQVKFIKDVTIPDEMDLAPGEQYTKTWRLENAGSCPWTIGYLLYFESGDSMGGPSSQDLTSQTILPGETIDISVDLVAPLETGIYQGNWKLRNVKGEGFGVGEFSKAFWVKINVVEGAGMMLDFNVRADEAAWGSGSSPVDYIDLGGKILNFDSPGESTDPYVALLDQELLEGGRISGILLATYPPQGAGKYIIGRFPDYKVNGGDLLFGRVGLSTNSSGNCGDGDVTYRIDLILGGDPATRATIWEWNEICDNQMKSFEIDLDDYKGEIGQLFLVVVANSNSDSNRAVWDSLSIHR
ncbi:MAG: hypothetical protein HQ574_06660 [Chloroflexi bacterium]|nr:hypothetical protein [Chloroflexota bacterium]